MRDFVWMCAVILGCVAGGLAGVLITQHLTPKPEPIILHHRPPIIVQPAQIRAENCVEVTRACFARKRSAAIGPKGD